MMSRGTIRLVLVHPHIEARKKAGHPTHKQAAGDSFNARLALLITNSVGTMYCAYLFGVLGIMGVVGAFTGNVQLVLIVGSVSGYFLQLVLLPIIIVGQNISAKASDARSLATYKDADAILDMCVQIQRTLEGEPA